MNREELIKELEAVYYNRSLGAVVTADGFGEGVWREDRDIRLLAADYNEIVRMTAPWNIEIIEKAKKSPFLTPEEKHVLGTGGHRELENLFAYLVLSYKIDKFPESARLMGNKDL